MEKVMFGARIPAEVAKAAKMLAVTENLTKQDLLEKALAAYTTAYQQVKYGNRAA